MQTIGKIPSVFLVDDDKMFLSSLKHELTEKFKGIRFETFINGEDCLKHIDQSPDLVVLDYYLTKGSPEGMNGIEVLKEIKSFHPDTEVIILSAQDKLEVAANAIKHGAFEYVTKSESAFVRLYNTIKKALNNMEASRLSRKYVMWNYVMATMLLLFLAFMVTHFLMHVKAI
jgi:two-component system OmpR family response regulator